MKESKYNYYKQYEPYYLAVNGRTGAVLLVDTRKYPHITKWNEQSMRGELFDTLVQYGFFVSDETDEIEELKIRHQNHLGGKEVLNVHVNPTLDCNLNCWYCYEGHVEHSQMQAETQERVLSYIRKQIRTGEYKGVHISYFGGEPFLKYFDVICPLNLRLEELCNLYKVNLSYSATTNGYLLADFCDELEVLTSGSTRWKSLQITLDGNENHHNELRKLKSNGAVSYHRILIQMLRVLKTDKVDVHLRINYSNANIQELFEVLEDIPTHLRTRLTISLHRIWQTQDEEEQVGVAEIYVRLKNQGFNLDAHRLLLGKREVCYADRDTQLLINYDGNVFKCTARDFVPENRLGYLDKNGNLVFEGERWVQRKKQNVWNNPRCANCNLVPICLGACSQLQFENKNVPCILNDKNAEVEVFMDQVLSKLMTKQQGIIME
jgi:uncharacterized protein